MSDSRLLLRTIGSLLASLWLCLPSFGQAIGSGLATSPTRRMQLPPRSTPLPSQYVPSYQRATQSGTIGTMHRQQPVKHVEPLAMPQPTAADEQVPEAIVPENAASSDPIIDGAFPDAFHDGYADGCACGGAGCDVCGHGLWAVLANARKRTELFYGVTSFTGPINRGGTGSNGFEGGLNMGTPLFGGWRGLGFQAGVGGTISDFNGSNFTRDTRNQVFITLGFFRRVDWGLQYGMVVDHMHDDWYGNVDLTQIRGEFSWMLPEGTDFGFLYAASNDDKIVPGVLQNGTAIPTTVNERWQVNDYYALFLRRNFARGGQARFFAGWSGTSDGVLGADAYIPLNNEWSLRNSFTYLIPEQGPLDGGAAKESWNLSMQLVWYPSGRNQVGRDYYRPLFNVANNGTMFVER